MIFLDVRSLFILNEWMNIYHFLKYLYTPFFKRIDWGLKENTKEGEKCYQRQRFHPCEEQCLSVGILYNLPSDLWWQGIQGVAHQRNLSLRWIGLISRPIILNQKTSWKEWEKISRNWPSCKCKVKLRNLHFGINIPKHFHYKMFLLLVKLLCFCTEKQIDRLLLKIPWGWNRLV